MDLGEIVTDSNGHQSFRFNDEQSQKLALEFAEFMGIDMTKDGPQFYGTLGNSTQK